VNKKATRSFRGDLPQRQNPRKLFMKQTMPLIKHQDNHYGLETEDINESGDKCMKSSAAIEYITGY